MPLALMPSYSFVATAQAAELSSLISQRYFAHVIGAEQRVWQ